MWFSQLLFSLANDFEQFQPELEVVQEENEESRDASAEPGQPQQEHVGIDMGDDEVTHESSLDAETVEVQLDLPRMLSTIQSVLCLELVQEVGALYQVSCEEDGIF